MVINGVAKRFGEREVDVDVLLDGGTGQTIQHAAPQGGRQFRP